MPSCPTVLAFYNCFERLCLFCTHSICHQNSLTAMLLVSRPIPVPPFSCLLCCYAIIIYRFTTVCQQFLFMFLLLCDIYCDIVKLLHRKGVLFSERTSKAAQKRVEHEARRLCYCSIHFTRAFIRH